MSETCLTDDIGDNEVECAGYKLLRNDSHSRHTGGCCMYLRSDIEVEIQKSATLEKKAWILSAKLRNGSEAINFTVVYFSPNGGKKACIEYFDDWCENYMDMNGKQVVCGDFNVDFLKYGTYQTKLKQVIASYGLKQVVKQATRITETAKTKIDLVMANIGVEAESLQTEKISDHSTISMKVEGFRCEAEHRKTVKVLKNYSPVTFRQLLAEYDWTSEAMAGMSLQDKSNTLIERITTSINSFVREVKIKENGSVGWFDDDLVALRQSKVQA